MPQLELVSITTATFYQRTRLRPARQAAFSLSFLESYFKSLGGTTMSETSTLIGYSGRTIGREELTLVPTPPATETHRPIPHHEIVRALVETLGFRHIGVVHDEYAVSPDGMKAFGVLDLETEMEGCRFSIGLRNSHDKSMRLAMTCGYRVFRVFEHGVCRGLHTCNNVAIVGSGRRKRFWQEGAQVRTEPRAAPDASIFAARFPKPKEVSRSFMVVEMR